MIYVHVPFCRSFCTYCDFYSEICSRNAAGAHEEYEKAVCAEIASRRGEIQATLATDTLYIGGGTPSVLPPVFFSRIIDAIGRSRFEEFTVEVNPEDIVEKGPSYVRALIDAGVNRISMGVQSLDDGMLRWMNRRHDSVRALQAYGILRDAGCANVSLDIIFGISHLSDATLEDTVRRIVALRPQHISAYQLSIEEGSALARMEEDGRYEEASQEQCEGQYRLICRLLAEAGYVHYEISNWALPGFEARHNSAYWKRVPYVGVGPGAHSFGSGRRSWNSQTLSGWTREEELLSPEEEREEQVMLGLRTAEGVDPLLCDSDALARMKAAGHLVCLPDGKVRIPEESFFVSDSIISELL